MIAVGVPSVYPAWLTLVDQAVAQLDGLKQQVVDTRASVASEVATLKAEKGLLAERDRTFRQELERLRVSRP
jgi:hypothetical protein